jgi:hypothetical protein
VKKRRVRRQVDCEVGILAYAGVVNAKPGHMDKKWFAGIPLIYRIYKTTIYKTTAYSRSSQSLSTLDSNEL